MKFLFKYLILSFVLFLIACDKDKEQTPSYIHIKNFTLTTNPATQGLNTIDVGSAKVFVNGKEIGNFELPATIPVLLEGNCSVEIYPNIKENASSQNNKYFIPYLPYIQSVNLKKLEIDTLAPNTIYRSNTTFAWLEDFENQTLSLSPYNQNTSRDSLKVIPTSTPGVDLPYSGSNFCAFLEMSKDSSAIFEVATINKFNLPNLGRDVYVELDIKTNVLFQIGIYTDDGINLLQTPVLVVNPTNNQWKKIYVNLKPETGNLRNGTQTKLFFGVFKSKSSLVTPKVYLDNLKLVFVN